MPAHVLRATACALFLRAAVGNVDAIFPTPGRASPPSVCAHGCALWSNLSADGNTRDQGDVNAKFRFGVAPSVRDCASPAYDPGESGPGWCYCRDVGASDWGYCGDASGSVPTQINLQFVNDAGATTISFVTIDGHAQGGVPVAQVSTAPDGSSAVNVTGVTNFWTQTGSARQYSFHFVPLQGLQPATTYYYRVSSGVAGAAWSAWFSYRTRDPSAPLRFAFAGDVGPYPVNHFDLIANASIATDETRIDFLVHGGDHAYQMSSDDGERGDLYLLDFEAALTRLPWLTVMGVRVRLRCCTRGMPPARAHPNLHTPIRHPHAQNHEEYNGAFFMRYLNQTAGVATASPRRDSSGAGGRYYSVDVGLLHLIVLDFNVYYGTEPDAIRAAQLSWLDADLTAVDRAVTPWVVVTAHMPIFCSSITLDGVFADADARYRVDVAGERGDAVAARAPYKGCTGTGVDNVEATRKDVEPLFIKHGVDLFLCGHEHNYESIWPTRNSVPTATNFDSPAATVYVVEGAGGAPALDLFGGPAPFTRKQDSSWGFGRVTIVNASTLVYERVQNDHCRDQCQQSTCPDCGVPAGTVLDTWTITQPQHGGWPPL